MSLHPRPKCKAATSSSHGWWRSNRHWCVNEDKNLPHECERADCRCCTLWKLLYRRTDCSEATAAFTHQLCYLGEAGQVEVKLFHIQKTNPVWFTIKSHEWWEVYDIQWTSDARIHCQVLSYVRYYEVISYFSLTVVMLQLDHSHWIHREVLKLKEGFLSQCSFQTPYCQPLCLNSNYTKCIVA